MELHVDNINYNDFSEYLVASEQENTLKYALFAPFDVQKQYLFNRINIVSPLKIFSAFFSFQPSSRIT